MVEGNGGNLEVVRTDDQAGTLQFVSNRCTSARTDIIEGQ
jgi:hypothetical protein